MKLNEEYTNQEILNYIDEVKERYDDFRHAVYALGYAVGEDDKQKERYLDIDLKDIDEQYKYLLDDISDIIDMYTDVDIEEDEEDED